MFLDTPDRAAYKSGMSLEEFALAAAPKEMHDALDGTMPEMQLEGISLDTKAFQAFRKNMTTVGARVVEEKKEFQKAKKWATDQHRDGEAEERMRAQLEEKKRKMRGKFLPELLWTILFLGVWFVVLDIITKVGTNPMAVFKHISSTWLVILFAIVSLVWLLWIFSNMRASKFCNIGRTIRFVLCILLVGLSAVSLGSTIPRASTQTFDISTKEELLAAKNFPKGTSFKLTADIDVEKEEIKFLFNEFYGTFDGNGYTISSVVLKKNARSGLFRENYGTIQNVKVNKIIVHWNHKGGYYAPNYKVAALVAENYGTVTGACSLTNVTYDHKDETDDRNQTVTLTKPASYDTCRGHFVAFNAGTVDTESFYLEFTGTNDMWDKLWSAFVGYTDMAYAVTPDE